LGLPAAAAAALGSLLGISYFVWMPVAYQGQNVGKMAAGVAIVRMDGSPLTYLRCLGRWAGYLLSGIVLGLGFIIAAFTSRKRALHDYLADTRVVYIEPIGTGRKALLIALAVILPALFLAGLIAALALPKLGGIASLAQEGADRQALASIRSAVSIHYSESQGSYPARLTDLVPRQLPAIPVLRLKNHPQSSEVAVYDGAVCAGGKLDETKLRDSGGWGYVQAPESPCNGTVFIDCTHKDARGASFASY
ncbi:MAG: RDD family protein, partial [Elusimicrobia bacterium]|nr:RDD family protein [Elusimicrobiota bacterium]